MTFGQPPDTAVMNFDGWRSMLWVMESLTAVPKGFDRAERRGFGLELGLVLMLPADHSAQKNSLIQIVRVICSRNTTGHNQLRVQYDCECNTTGRNPIHSPELVSAGSLERANNTPSTSKLGVKAAITPSRNH
jgi:hypothetical protein